ncbi:triose-phosphate isomerase [Candidatus Dependentiae bacterium]|nr:triose-phosphate isomerase [Candidatus Dependentiae bacterium]
MEIVLNWKMEKSHLEEILWCKENKEELIKLSTNNHFFILCPSFTSLQTIKEIFDKSEIEIGAQNCSQYLLGSHTGQVSAKSLKEIGCLYCIIGHSETRTELNENYYQIAKKTKALISQHINPIICIGETREEKDKNLTLDALAQQLEPIVQEIINLNVKEIIFAYEPVWAIGSGNTPLASEIYEITKWVKMYLKVTLPEVKTKVLYGGSISSRNIDELKNIFDLDGFLIGKASLDIQEIKKIVTSKGK